MQNSFLVSGSCNINSRGIFQASIISDQKNFYMCNDRHLNKILQDIYQFLMSSEEKGVIASKSVRKTITKRQKRKCVTIDLGPLHIQMFTTRKPAVAWLLIGLPFTATNVDWSEEEEL